MQPITRALLVAALVCFVAPAAGAQSPGARVSFTAPLDSQYAGALTHLADKVIALAEAIPADRYGWRPAPEVRSVSEVLTHLAGEWYYLCPVSIGAKPPADFGPPGDAMKKLERITEKPEVLKELRRAWAHCRLALDRINPAALVPDSLPGKMGFARTVLLVSGDQHEHLGQLIAYARSVGVAPPWSR